VKSEGDLKIRCACEVLEACLPGGFILGHSTPNFSSVLGALLLPPIDGSCSKGGKKSRPTVRQWDAPEMEEEDGLTDIFAFDEDAPLQPLILPRPPYGIPKSSLAAWESLPTLPSVAAIDSVRT
jgi:hypothetical protein